MNCPRDVNPGEPITATYMRELTRFVRSLTPFAGPGIKIRRSSAGTHFVSTATGTELASGDEDAGPFRVRRVIQDSTAGIPYSGWEIYLPAGCLNVNTSSVPINVAATRIVSGSSKTVPDWYRMPFPSGTPSDGDVWDVEVHAKTKCGLSGVDQLANWGKNYMFAEIHKHDRSAAETSADQSDCGDDLSAVVCRIEWAEDEDNNLAAEIVRTVKRPLSATVANNREFELIWGVEVSSSTLALTVARMLVKNCAFSAAGTTFSSNTLTEITMASGGCAAVKYVYLKVSAATTPYTGEILCYDGEEHGSSGDMTAAANITSDTGPFDVMVRLFVLDNCRITEDDRLSAQNIQLYKA